MRLKKPARNILILLILVAAGASAYAVLTPDYRMRPEFTLPDLSGTPRHISEFDGQVLVINFWATWCIPCREEIPMLIEAQADLGDEGLQVIGIAVDKRKAAAAFAKRYGINYPVLVDLQKAARVQDAYTQPGDPQAVLPYTVIVDRRGRIRASVAGKLNRKQLEALVQPLLAAHPDQQPD